MSKAAITLLVDTSATPPFTPEFGLSLYVEYKHRRILFDTGAGEALRNNSGILGFKQEDFSHVILSHGHADHTGGLAFLKPEKIYGVPGVEKSRISLHPGMPPHVLTMPDASRKVLHASMNVWISCFQEVFPGMYLTGPIPRVSGENCGGDFFCGTDCTRADTIDDEQALLLDNGTLIVGCCHAGIINTLEYCKQKHPEIQIHTIAGGMHLAHADPIRLEKTAVYLRTSQVRTIFPLHCTGEMAIAYLRKELPDMHFQIPQVGTCIIIE